MKGDGVGCVRMGHERCEGMGWVVRMGGVGHKRCEDGWGGS
jgi:hypothetical protein